jgi:uncharacterized protein (DUF305 family)
MKKYASGFALLLVLTSSFLALAWQGTAHPPGNDAGAGVAWPELGRGMEKMQVEMMSIKPSGNNDVDFVRLMLPHHQAAIDMAKAELAYGKDPQLRRLAQEIITDQESEAELMHLWLKQHEPHSHK